MILRYFHRCPRIHLFLFFGGWIVPCIMCMKQPLEKTGKEIEDELWIDYGGEG